jgi:SAM-dependent methyltransferase
LKTAFAEARTYLSRHLEGSLFRTQFPVGFLVKWLMMRVENTYVPGGTILDLGGGFSLINAALSRLGMNVYCADLMSDYFVHSSLKSAMTEQFDFLKKEGVRFIHCDLLEYDFKDFSEASLDVVCSFHAFEHFHHSPRRLCEHAMRMLKPGGTFFLEIPNALNALKRLRVLVGRTNYLPYAAYWNSSRWLGHVREYSLGDLTELADHLQFSRYRIFGLNYYGTLYPKLHYSFLACIVDHALRARPGLCAALCLKGTK